MSEGISTVGGRFTGFSYEASADNSQISRSGGFEELFIQNLEQQRDEISSTHFTAESKLSRAGIVWNPSNVSVNFTDAKGKKVEVAMSNTNLSRLQEKFPEDISGDEKNVLAKGQARDYLATMWQEFYDKQWVERADKNSDGTLSVEEQLRVRSFVEDGTGKHYSADELFRNEKTLLEQYKSELKEITIDEAFDHFVGIDKNLDLKISIDEGLDNGVLVSDYNSLVEFNNETIEGKRGSKFSKENWERLDAKVDSMEQISLNIRDQIKNALIDLLLFDPKKQPLNQQRFSLQDALNIA